MFFMWVFLFADDLRGALKYYFRKALGVLSASFCRFFNRDPSCTFHHACPFLFLFLPFVLPRLLFTPSCFDAHFWSCIFCVFVARLLAFILFFPSLPLFPSPVFLFPPVLRLPPSACLNRRLQLLRLD